MLRIAATLPVSPRSSGKVREAEKLYSSSPSYEVVERQLSSSLGRAGPSQFDSVLHLRRAL